MKVIIGNQWYPTLEASSCQITRSATDPVPTCTLNLIDINSTLKPKMMQEILVLDDKLTPNPTVNMAPNPTLNPYTTLWGQQAATGLTYSQTGGGGITMTLSNVALNGALFIALFTYIPGGDIVHGSWPGEGMVIPGQNYTLSYFVQGLSSPSNFSVYSELRWLDASSNTIRSSTDVIGPNPPSTSNVRYTLTDVAPAGAAVCEIRIGLTGPNATNSGAVSITNVMLEPDWFPTVSYPTPFCGPSQTNCQQLPLGQWIRQYRKFAGFVNHVTAQDYHGNVRTLVVDSVGYAWLAGTIDGNDSFSSQTDSAVISSLLSKYLTNTYLLVGGTNMCTTTNVVTGITVTSLQSNWDDLRTLFDGLCGLSGFYWTIDYYWNFIYAPPGYFSMGIGLICDNSSQPDMITTYPAYNFSAEQDFTQPGSSILTIGSGTNVSQVIDPSQTGQIGNTSGYLLPTGSSWMRKVNDSTLASVADCTTRGMAELLQYDFTRNIYHLTTNVELVPGESIALTSATEGLSASVQLIQQTQASWIGTNETLNDEWEYVSDLGATNRHATNMISRIFRVTQKNTSAPAISATTLALIENIGIVDSIDSSSSYAETVLVDAPLAYYRLGEPAGFGITSAYDWSGNIRTGTIMSNVTLGTAGLIYNDTNTAVTLDGSTGYISLPLSGLPTGASPWTLEAWVSIASIPSHTFSSLVSFGTFNTHQMAGISIMVSGGAATFLCTTFSGDISGGSVVPGSIYHVIGSYDGANTRLFVNGQLVAGPFAVTLNVVLGFSSIGAENSPAQDFLAGIADETAIYAYALPISQILKHYAAGTRNLLGNLYTNFSLYAGTVYADNPIAYYRLGEATASTAYDWTTTNYHGAITGGVSLIQTALLFNDPNTSMLFNGSTGYINLPTTLVPTGAHPWTLECWTRFSSIPANGNHVMLGFGGTGVLGWGILQVNVTSGVPIFQLGTNTGDISSGTIAINTTYHVVGSYDGTSVRLFVNNVLVAGPTAEVLNLTQTWAAIGAYQPGGPNSFYPGLVQECACYNYALPANRIQAHYNVGAFGHL